MTAELEALLQSSYTLRKTLSQVLPTNAVDYIIELIVKDGAHRNYLKITGDDEN
jgi:hypothetical protein